MVLSGVCWNLFELEFDFNCDSTGETPKDGDVNSAKRAISAIQQKDVKYADAKVPVPKITTAIEKLANVNARRIMMDISATSVRFVYLHTISIH